MGNGKKIIVALDTANLDSITPLAEALAPHIWGFKFGPATMVLHSPGEIVAWLQTFLDDDEISQRIFVDTMFHHVPDQVFIAARGLAELGVGMFTVHASGGYKMVKAAVDGVADFGCTCGKRQPLVLAATVLTSHTDHDCRDIYCASVESRVMRFSILAKNAGANGVVCSATDLAAFHRQDMEGCAGLLKVVTGVRPTWSPQGAHMRFVTPGDAVKAGADLLVIGGGLTSEKDPLASFRQIVEEMDEAMISA